MPDNPVDFKNILREEGKAKLSVIDKDFYEKAHKMFREIESEIDNTDKDTMKYAMLSDELVVAKINFEAILEIRMGKIIKEASIRKSLKQKEQHVPENLVTEEKELYDVLFSPLVKWRKEHLYEKPKEPAIIVKAAPEVEVVEVKKPVAPKDLRRDYILVRVLRDIPTFVGSDLSNYTLGKEDVVTVPAINAMALISKKAAVQIGVTSSPAAALTLY